MQLHNQTDSRSELISRFSALNGETGYEDSSSWRMTGERKSVGSNGWNFALLLTTLRQSLDLPWQPENAWSSCSIPS